MILNRTIKLNKQIRAMIIDKFLEQILLEDPRPTIDDPRTAAKIKAREDWMKRRISAQTQLAGILDTFSSVNQLEDLWPELFAFVPQEILDPSKHFHLPKGPAK